MFSRELSLKELESNEYLNHYFTFVNGCAFLNFTENPIEACDADIVRGKFTLNNKLMVLILKDQSALTKNGHDFKNDDGLSEVKNAWNQYIQLAGNIIHAAGNPSTDLNTNNPFKYNYDISSNINIAEDGTVTIISKANNIKKNKPFDKEYKPKQIPGSVVTTVEFCPIKNQFKYVSCVFSSHSLKKELIKPKVVKTEKPSFFSKVKNWRKRHPIATGLLIGVGAALLVAGIVTAILLLAPILPFLAPAALVIGGVAGALYGVLGGFGVSGTAATAAIAGTHLLASGTLGAGTGAAVKLTTTCTTAKLAKTLGTGVGSMPPKNKKTGDAAPSEKNPSCLAGLLKSLSGVTNTMKKKFSPRP